MIRANFCRASKQQLQKTQLQVACILHPLTVQSPLNFSGVDQHAIAHRSIQGLLQYLWTASRLNVGMQSTCSIDPIVYGGGSTRTSFVRLGVALSPQSSTTNY